MYVCSNQRFFPHLDEGERRLVQTLACRKIQKEIRYFTTKGAAAKLNCDDYLGDAQALCTVRGAWCVVKWENCLCVHHVGDEHTPIWVGGPAGPIWCGGGTASIDMLVCHCVLPAVYLRQPPSHHMTHTSAYPRVFSKVGWLVFG